MKISRPSKINTSHSSAFKTVALCFILLSVFVLPSSVVAQTDEDIKKENEEIEKQKEEIEKQKEKTGEQVASQTKTVETLAQELKKLDTEVSKLSAKVSSEESKLNSARVQIAYMNEAIAEKEGNISEVQARIAEQAILSFQLSGNTEVDSSDISESLRMQTLFETVTQDQIEDISRLEDLVGQLEQEKSLVLSLEAEIEKAKQAIEAEKDGFEESQKKQAALVVEAENLLESRLAEAAVLSDRDEELSKKLQSNNAELTKRVARAAAPSGSGGNYAATDEEDIVRVQGIQIHSSMAADLDNLLTAAANDGIKLSGWGYRSSKRQVELRIQNCGGSSHYIIYQKSSSSCRPPTARPGRSNHETGKAVDFTYKGSTIKSRNSVAFKWMKANAHKYNFYNLPSEPWHWSVNGN